MPYSHEWKRFPSLHLRAVSPLVNLENSQMTHRPPDVRIVNLKLNSLTCVFFRLVMNIILMWKWPGVYPSIKWSAGSRDYMVVRRTVSAGGGEAGFIDVMHEVFFNRVRLECLCLPFCLGRTEGWSMQHFHVLVKAWKLYKFSFYFLSFMTLCILSFFLLFLFGSRNKFTLTLKWTK